MKPNYMECFKLPPKSILYGSLDPFLTNNVYPIDYPNISVISNYAKNNMIKTKYFKQNKSQQQSYSQLKSNTQMQQKKNQTKLKTTNSRPDERLFVNQNSKEANIQSQQYISKFMKQKLRIIRAQDSDKFQQQPPLIYINSKISCVQQTQEKHNNSFNNGGYDTDSTSNQHNSKPLKRYFYYNQLCKRVLHKQNQNNQIYFNQNNLVSNNKNQTDLAIQSNFSPLLKPRLVRTQVKDRKSKYNQKNEVKDMNSCCFTQSSPTKKLINTSINRKQNLNQTKKLKQSEFKPKFNHKLNKPIIPYDIKQLTFIKSQSYTIMEFPSRQIILSFRSKTPLQIASLTKIMTCYLILKLCYQNSINLKKQKIQIGEFVQNMTGTSAQLLPGDILTIEQLLYGLMLPSGNDAAICLANWGGKFFSNKQQDYVKVFVQQMNRRAKKLGLQNTRYGNPHGLPHPESRSCAFDVCQLAAICMDIPQFNQIVNTKEFRQFIPTIFNVDRQLLWQNTNKLLRRQGFRGIKTGITITAGPCLASAYNFRDKTYIITLLRANKVSRRFTQTRKLLYWTLKKLNTGGLNEQEQLKLFELKKRNRQLDSDNSQDEKEFVYGINGDEQFRKRKKIIKYQL